MHAHLRSARSIEPAAVGPSNASSIADCLLLFDAAYLRYLEQVLIGGGICLCICLYNASFTLLISATWTRCEHAQLRSLLLWGLPLPPASQTALCCLMLRTFAIACVACIAPPCCKPNQADRSALTLDFMLCLLDAARSYISPSQSHVNHECANFASAVLRMEAGRCRGT